MAERIHKDTSTQPDDKHEVLSPEKKKKRFRQLLLRTVVVLTLAGGPAAIRLREVPGIVIDALVNHKFSDPLKRGEVNADFTRVLHENLDRQTAEILLMAADRLEAGREFSAGDLVRLTVDVAASGWGVGLDNSQMISEWMAKDQAAQQRESDIQSLTEILAEVETLQVTGQPLPSFDQDMIDQGEQFWSTEAARLNIPAETLEQTVQTLKTIWRNNLEIGDVIEFIEDRLRNLHIDHATQRGIFVAALQASAEQLAERGITNPNQIGTISETVFGPLLPALAEVTPQGTQQRHDFLRRVFEVYGNKTFIPTIRDFQQMFQAELAAADRGEGTFPYRDVEFGEYQGVMAELDASTAGFSTTPEHQPDAEPNSFSAVLAFQYGQQEGQPLRGPIHLIIQRNVDGNYDYIATDPQYLENPGVRQNKLIGFTDDGRSVIFSAADAINAFPAATAQESMTKFLAVRKIRSAYVPNGIYDAETNVWSGFPERLDQYVSTVLVVTREGRTFAIHMQKTESADGQEPTAEEIEEQFFVQLENDGITRESVLYVAQGEFQFSVIMSLNGNQNILSPSPRDAYFFTAGYKNSSN